MSESMKGLKRTHRCAELSAANVGEVVTVKGIVAGGIGGATLLNKLNNPENKFLWFLF